MTRKKENIKVEETKQVEELVLVRVVNNFNDATDNERFISAGPNTFYRTNKSRADMLVDKGFCEYDVTIGIDLSNQEDFSVKDIVDNINVDNSNDINNNENPNK